MAIRCPVCGQEYDVTLFEFGNTVRCLCGSVVRLEHMQMPALDEEQKISAIKRLADRIAYLIVYTEIPESQIEVEKQNLKEKVAQFFPDKAYLYDLIYAPRFERLKEQFRGGMPSS